MYIISLIYIYIHIYIYILYIRYVYIYINLEVQDQSGWSLGWSMSRMSEPSMSEPWRFGPKTTEPRQPANVVDPDSRTEGHPLPGNPRESVNWYTWWMSRTCWDDHEVTVEINEVHKRIRMWAGVVGIESTQTLFVRWSRIYRRCSVVWKDTKYCLNSKT